MAVWVRFWCSSRFTRKKTRREPVHAALVHIQKRGKSSFVIYETVVFSFFHKKSSFSEEGEKLLCNLSTVIFDIVAFPFRFPDVQKRGKSSCVIYRPVIIPFPQKNRNFQKRAKSSFVFYHTVILLLFPTRKRDFLKRGKRVYQAVILFLFQLETKFFKRGVKVLLNLVKR